VLLSHSALVTPATLAVVSMRSLHIPQLPDTLMVSVLEALALELAWALKVETNNMAIKAMATNFKVFILIFF
jgi:hypothetical protein